jgi:hypothetical protein
VSESSGFAATSREYQTGVENNATLAGYYEYHLPYYEKLRTARMRVAGGGDQASGDRNHRYQSDGRAI